MKQKEELADLVAQENNWEEIWRLRKEEENILDSYDLEPYLSSGKDIWRVKEDIECIIGYKLKQLDIVGLMMYLQGRYKTRFKEAKTYRVL